MTSSSGELLDIPPGPGDPIDPRFGGPAELRPDGRSLRRERNRDRVIQALVDLIREGGHSPGAAAIADRAGVSHRSVFRYFDDMDDLVREVIRSEFASVVEVAGLGDIGVGSLAERISRLVHSRTTAYDLVYEISQLARRRSGDVPAIDRSLRRIDGYLRHELEEHFAPELAGMTDIQRETALDLLVTITSFESFDLLRRSYERSDEQISQRWTAALELVLAPANDTA
jgi:AcrR family transcriptional regulator